MSADFWLGVFVGFFMVNLPAAIVVYLICSRAPMVGDDEVRLWDAP